MDLGSGRRRPIRPSNTTTTRAAEKCIYCGSDKELTREHVIPYFLAGGLVFPKSSCKDCSQITQKFEDTLSYTFFFALRRRFSIQSRSKGGPTGYCLTVEEDGRKINRLVSFDQLPPVVAWPLLEPAGILMEREANNIIGKISFSFSNISGLVPGPCLDGEFSLDVDLHLFMRLMAKIAHGMFMSSNFDQTWQPLLKDSIRFGHLLPFYVGGFDDEQADLPQGIPPPSEKGMQKPLQLCWTYSAHLPQDPNSEYLIFVIEPFSLALNPKYEIVTARRSLPNIATLQSAKQTEFPIGPQVQFTSEPISLHIKVLTTPN